AEIEARSEHLSDLALHIWPYFGDEQARQGDQISVTGKTPRSLWILGQQFEVESWRDVMKQTIVTIAELEPDKFEQLMREYPRFIGRSKERFRDPRELPNGIFIEVNLSAQAIQRFCAQALSAIGLTTDDWKVETTA